MSELAQLPKPAIATLIFFMLNSSWSFEQAVMAGPEGQAGHSSTELRKHWAQYVRFVPDCRSGKCSDYAGRQEDPRRRSAQMSGDSCCAAGWPGIGFERLKQVSRKGTFESPPFPFFLPVMRDEFPATIAMNCERFFKSCLAPIYSATLSCSSADHAPSRGNMIQKHLP